MTASFFKSLFQWKLNNVIKLNITVTRARQEVGKIEGRFWTLSPFMKKKKKRSLEMEKREENVLCCKLIKKTKHFQKDHKEDRNSDREWQTPALITKLFKEKLGFCLSWFSANSIFFFFKLNPSVISLPEAG